MEKLKDNERQYWEGYLRTLSVEDWPENPSVLASMAGNRDITDELLQLYLTGKKTAGSGIAEDYIFAGEPLPKAGNYWILLNSKNQPCCILKTEKVMTNKFKDVPAQIAIAEGEGDLSLEHWRCVHTEIYSPFLAKWGVTEIGQATVITEFFKIVYQ